MRNDNTTDDGWSITVEATNDEAQAILAQDRVVHCFALTDLLPPFRQHTRIALATHAHSRRWATLLMLEHPDLCVLATSGAAEGVAALLAHADVPAHPLLQTLPEHWPLLARRYELPASPRDLLRMHLTAQTFRPPSAAGLPATERLTRSDLPALLDLYTLFPTGHFRPDLLDAGLFYGVREGARIVAAGGTHVLTLPYGLAVLGNIFTHPDWRGRGCAQAITAALITDLLGQGCQDIILNVEADNHPALRVYTKLGFQEHCHIWSGPATRRTE